MSTQSSTIHQYWRRNLFVCFIGSLTTIIAMTLLLPFLPVYVEELGITDHGAIAQWSGAIYSATFLTAALTAPLWGKLSDRFGRKVMLIRASLGMAIAMSLMGLAHSPWALLVLRLLAGLLGGYASGSMILVATQTPKEKTAWAVGVLSSGIMTGNLIGPLIGGALPQMIGIRDTFLCVGGIIFLTFLGTTFLLKEAPVEVKKKSATNKSGFYTLLKQYPTVGIMFLTGSLFLFANMSIEPIITLYISQLTQDSTSVTFIAGITMSAMALGSILAASRLGKLGDKIGHRQIIVGGLFASALLLIPQAFVSTPWMLIALRFLMGIALAGILPCVTSMIRHTMPSDKVGEALGFSTSAQYLGQVAGPLLGGYTAAHAGITPVFIGTAVIMFLAALLNIYSVTKTRR